MVIVVADATLFERALSGTQSHTDKSTILLFQTLFKIFKTTPEIHPCIVLTKRDLLAPETKHKDIIAVANRISTEVCLFENFHQDVKDKDKVCVDTLELLGNLFDLIDAKLGTVPEKETPLLKIDHAWYGKLEGERINYDKGEQATHSVVVTDVLAQKLVRDGGRYVHINPSRYNKVFGDPFPGRISNRFRSPKILHVEYTVGDVELVKNVRECEPFDLP